MTTNLKLQDGTLIPVHFGTWAVMKYTELMGQTAAPIPIVDSDSVENEASNKQAMIQMSAYIQKASILKIKAGIEYARRLAGNRDELTEEDAALVIDQAGGLYSDEVQSLLKHYDDLNKIPAKEDPSDSKKKKSVGRKSKVTQ